MTSLVFLMVVCVVANFILDCWGSYRCTYWNLPHSRSSLCVLSYLSRNDTLMWRTLTRWTQYKNSVLVRPISYAYLRIAFVSVCFCVSWVALWFRCVSLVTECNTRQCRRFNPLWFSWWFSEPSLLTSFTLCFSIPWEPWLQRQKLPLIAYIVSDILAKGLVIHHLFLLINSTLLDSTSVDSLQWP